jgi:uncharacterized protein (TIGR02246 family)
VSLAAPAVAPPAPLEAVDRFSAALNGGALDAAAACFTREACLITPDGTAINGRSEIAAILAQLIARGTRIEAEHLVLQTAGDVALASGRLTMRCPGPAEQSLTQSLTSALALRRLEARWKISIFSPWALSHPLRA